MPRWNEIEILILKTCGNVKLDLLNRSKREIAMLHFFGTPCKYAVVQKRRHIYTYENMQINPNLLHVRQCIHWIHPNVLQIWRTTLDEHEKIARARLAAIQVG